MKKCRKGSVRRRLTNRCYKKSKRRMFGSFGGGMPDNLLNIQGPYGPAT